tara:strand:+ start:12382 stop:13128 length:747 start_codon:yes stop_codon:yes gene_type:complete
MIKKINNKGIILAGGSGTRLYPLTKITSKQLLPIYDKPMIYYPLRLLIDAGIDDILIITTPHDKANFFSLLGNGEDWGVEISYKKQKEPDGIAQAFIIAEEWLENSNVTLILGDNLFFGKDISNKLKNAINNNQGATIFGYQVNDPNRFGVIEFDSNKNIISIKEKPKETDSNWAVTGLYVYNKDVYKYSKTLKKSKRGELEITDLNLIYLKNKKLQVEFLDKKNYSWLDTGTFEAMLEASNYVKNNS